MSKNFEELLKALQQTDNEVDQLAKALPMAGGDGGDGGNPEDGEEEGAADGGEGNDDAAIAAAAAAAAAEAAKGGKEAPLGKSMVATDADGNQIDAVDATELVKSLVERLDTGDANLAKAMETFTGLFQKQNALIKSLGDRITELAGQGRGRKTTLVVTEKPDAGTLAKSTQPEELTRDTLMAKADAAFGANKISGLEFTRLDVALRTGVVPDADVVQRILSA